MSIILILSINSTLRNNAMNTPGRAFEKGNSVRRKVPSTIAIELLLRGEAAAIRCGAGRSGAYPSRRDGDVTTPAPYAHEIAVTAAPGSAVAPFGVAMNR